MAKTVVITGAASGIGKGTAELFAKKGYQLVVSDINKEAGAKLADDLDAEAIFVPCDTSKYEQVQHLMSSAIDRFGQIDVLVNNAGIGGKTYCRTEDHPLDEWDEVLAVNQNGVFYGMRLALKQMMKQGHGNIVNISSLAGLKGTRTGLAYSASKHAVVGMTKSAAIEYGKKNIRINCVCPGFIETPLMKRLVPDEATYQKVVLPYTPMKRAGQVEEVAQAVYWLASDESSYITGHAMVVDGGTSV